MVIFRQFFEQTSFTYTYLVACEQTRQAVFIDPVHETFDRDVGLLSQLDLTLASSLETHIHADHMTSALRLKSALGAKIALPAGTGSGCADQEVAEDTPLAVGTITIKPLFTPGHTSHHHSYLLDGDGWRAVLTGDSLLIDGCGRTDFQGGNSADLYRSIHDKLFTLGDDTLVYPGHDYKGRRVSSIGQEKNRNPRLGGDKDLADFQSIMDNLNLPYPKKIDLAVPANMLCGACPDDIPEDMRKMCETGDQG